MKRTLVISDIHGELELFEELLQKAGYDAAEDQLILLGDYVDRGPDSKGVLERVIELKKLGAIVLSGNHDAMMLAAADGEPAALERWARNGAIPTLQSYDPSIKDAELPTSDSFWEHIAFIKEMDFFHETADYIFVHAGVQPGIPVQETDPYILIWIREEFYEVYEGEKTVVFGHTPAFLLRGEGSNDIYFGDNNIIGIDGGAAYGGQLNCLELPSRKSYFVKKR
ncbi:metallophosphoesterase family protein [Planococcus halotolerans]|uniref:Serine/threonine protein phosphatase n=1 Tax=Planococcus halotolerans TaxID=2233542 RepID=A0A365L7M2_9BACL|nr:metallophosphoesterase family protein [Planococcus halotolerans]RAZ81412.1 serine/threonine protein phosphatase [Planococcus halotolerans]